MISHPNLLQCRVPEAAEFSFMHDGSPRLRAKYVAGGRETNVWQRSSAISFV